MSDKEVLTREAVTGTWVVAPENKPLDLSMPKVTAREVAGDLASKWTTLEQEYFYHTPPRRDPQYLQFGMVCEQGWSLQERNHYDSFGRDYQVRMELTVDQAHDMLRQLMDAVSNGFGDSMYDTCVLNVMLPGRSANLTGARATPGYCTPYRGGEPTRPGPIEREYMRRYYNKNIDPVLGPPVVDLE